MYILPCQIYNTFHICVSIIKDVTHFSNNSTSYLNLYSNEYRNLMIDLGKVQRIRDIINEMQ